MSDQSLITVSAPRFQLALTVEAEAQKAAALEKSSLIGRVSSADEQELAVAAQAQLKLVLRNAEEARKAAKEPVLDAGRLIDSTIKKYIEEMQAEESRIARLVADFQALELARIRAAEASRRLDEQTIERERQEALAKAQSHDDLDAINERFNQQAAALPVARTAPRVVGQKVSEDWDIQVSDVHALYRAHPGCCKITPLLSEIKQLLNMGIKVHGVNASRVVKAGVLTPRQATAIEA